MQLTKFLKLRKAIEGLDPHFISTRLHELDRQLKLRGLPLNPLDTVITQEGIFYVEPKSGIATKVIAYVGEFTAALTNQQRHTRSRAGYKEVAKIEQFGPYHLMRCNVITEAEKEGWPKPYTLTRRFDGTFFYSIVGPAKRNVKPQVFQEIDAQKLYVCKNCFWKASSILGPRKLPQRESFDVHDFFDVNQARSWNSLGSLAKDYGFMKNMYPGDWLEISRLRMKQTNYHCEYCCRDLSSDRLRKYLQVYPTDHIENAEGYVRLESLCIACSAELPGCAALRQPSELAQYQLEIAQP